MLGQEVEQPAFSAPTQGAAGQEAPHIHWDSVFSNIFHFIEGSPVWGDVGTLFTLKLVFMFASLIQTVFHFIEG